MSQKSEKPHSCKECGKTFSNTGHLGYHMKTHSSAKYECGVCSKRFMTNAYLKIHCASHTKPQLKLHQQKHRKTETREQKKIGRYQCEFCQQRFSIKSDLKRHEYVHSDEKLNQCQVCVKSFKTKIGLWNHTKSHGEKSEKCLQCGRNGMTDLRNFEQKGQSLLLQKGVDLRQAR